MEILEWIFGGGGLELYVRGNTPGKGGDERTNHYIHETDTPHSTRASDAGQLGLTAFDGQL